MAICSELLDSHCLVPVFHCIELFSAFGVTPPIAPEIFIPDTFNSDGKTMPPSGVADIAVPVTPSSPPI